MSLRRHRGPLGRDGGPEDARERGLEVRLHPQLVAVGHDHAAEFRQRAFRGRQVQRLDIQQRVLNGNRQEAAADDLRAALTP